MKKAALAAFFIELHPGATDQDMLELALWLKGSDANGRLRPQPAMLQCANKAVRQISGSIVRRSVSMARINGINGVRLD